MKKFILFFFSALVFSSALGQGPSTAAPDPSCDSGDVISMFSNVYTDVPVDTWLTVWSAANLQDIQIAGNDTKLYTNVNFLGIETTGPNLIDASAMVNFHMDIWTPNMTTFRVKLVDFGPNLVFGGGDDSEHEIVIDNPAQNEWVSLDIPLAAFTGLNSTEHLAQLILSGIPVGGGTVYVDNVYYSNSNCVTAAPDPTCEAANVISMFSNVYTDVPVDTWLTVWSSANLEDIQISGNDTKKYTNVDFLGIETTGPNLIDASAMSNFNIDIWTPNMTTFRVKLVDFGPNLVFGGGDDSEHEVTFNSPAQNEWISYEIPLSAFTGLNSTEHLAQLILSGIPVGGGTVYVDNVYYSTCISDVEVELCVDLSCITGPTTAPAVGGSFNGQCAGCDFLSDPDGDGTWCATVSMAPGVQDYRFFYQQAGFENFTTIIPGCTDNFGGQIRRTITVEAGMPQSVTYGWESCEVSCAPPPAPNVELCVDLSCIPGSTTAPAVGGSFNGQCAGCDFLSDPDGDGIWCATVMMDPGVQDFRFFYQEAGFEVFTQVTPGCTGTFNGQIRRSINVTGAPQSFTFGWQSCDQMCMPPPPPPDLPITFEDPDINYNLGDFAGAVSIITTDPTDPGNMVVCTNKTNGAATFAGTVAGNDGLENPIPFTPTETKMTVRVWSPTANTPVLLKVEDANNPGIFMEVIVNTTQSMTWETLVFDFSTSTNQPLNLNNTYSKVVIFFDFGSFGNNSIYYWDDVMMCPSEALTLACPADLVLECNDATDPSATGEPTGTEVGGGAIVFTFEDVSDVTSCDGGKITRTWTGTDGCGNTGTCDQIIMVNPPPPPVITCPADITVSCEDEIMLDPNNATATSLCGSIMAIWIQNPDGAGAPGCNGTVYTYQYVALDDCGRQGFCTQTVTVVNTPATITVPAGGTVECFEDIDLTIGDATVENACADYEFYLTTPELNGEQGCPGTTYTYTYRVVDVCGNTIEEDVVFTNGNSANPTIVAPADFTVDCLGTGPNPDAAVVTTSCGTGFEVTVSDPVISGPLDCSGTTYTYTYTVTDKCGRTAMDTQVLTVSNGSPVFDNCPDDNWLQLNCEDFGGEDGTISIIEAWIGTVTASSSCGALLTVTNDFNPNNINTCINNGILEVDFKATDACGRSTTCTGTIVVVDTEAPMIVEEAQDHYEMCNFNTQANLNAWVANLAGAEAVDGCSGDNISWTVSPGNPQINCTGNTGTTSVEVTFIVTDNCGNKTSTTATFNALPAPGFNESGQSTQLDNDGGISLFQNQPNPFKNETQINFYLPMDMEATLVVYDITGKQLKVIRGDYAKGFNNLSIARSDFSARGVLIYQLQTELGSVTKRMIITE